MLNDLPTTNDVLGRRPFADSLARVIVTQRASAHQVIAIDGAWGDGKTTVFGFLSSSLKDQGFKVMEFNPWRYDNEDTMLRAFALGLGEVLGVRLLKKREQLVESAQDRAEWFSQVASAAGAERVGGLLHFGMSKLRVTIEDLMGRVRGELNQHAHRVTILVDDSDRLEADQLMNLFRLIKLIAGFEWLTFVLAMDCAAVARTIDRRFGESGEGQRYLEKIIQVPVRLPTIPHAKLKDFSLQLIQAVLNDLSVKLDQTEISRFRASFDAALMPLIRTPRSAKQYANVVRFSLGLLPGEINPVDVMLLEGIRLFVPQLFQTLNALILPKVEPHWMEQRTGGRENRAESLMNALLEGLSKDDSPRWHDVLIGLFPSKLSQADPDEATFLSWTNNKRVSCDEYFIRYLAATVPDNDMPDAEVSRWMALAESDHAALKENIKSRITPQIEEVIIQKLRRIERDLNDSQRKSFALAIANISDQITLRERAWQSEVAFGQSAIFAAKCVTKLPLTERENFAANVIRASSSGMWAVEFLWKLPRDKNGDTDEPVSKRDIPLSKAEFNRLGTVAADKLIAAILSAIERPPLDFLRRICVVCAEYGKKDEIRSWFKQQLTNDPTFILDFASLIMKWMYSNDERQMEWPGDVEARRKADEYIDVDWLLQTISPPEWTPKDWYDFRISKEEAASRLFKLLSSPTQSDPISAASAD